MCSKLQTAFVGTTFEFEFTSELLEKYIAFNMIMGSMNEIWMNYIRHVVSVMWPTNVSCITAVHKSSPVASWDSKVSKKCTLQNLSGRTIGHIGTFCLLFEYYEFGHTILFQHSASKEVLNFRHSFCQYDIPDTRLYIGSLLQWNSIFS